MPPFDVNDYLCWAGPLSSYLAVLRAEEKKNEGSANDLMQAFYYDEEDDDDEDKEKDPLDEYKHMIQVIDNLAVIHIGGPLVPQSSFWTRIFGMTGYDEVRNAVIAAGSDSRIDSILLDIDSPGGSAKGVDEAADAIKEVDEKLVPVTSFTSGSMTSAAYWLGSSARSVYATQMSTVGSIGVILVHQEISKMLDNEGINPTVFTAGKYKGIGNPYEALSEFDRGVIQTKMDEMYDHFVGVVAKNRGRTSDYIKENSAEGQEFWGKDASAVGLIDGVLTFDEVVKLLDKDHNSSKSEDSFGLQTGATTMLRKKSVIMTQAAQDAIAAGVPENEALAQHAAPAPEGEEETIQETAEASESEINEVTEPETEQAQADPADEGTQAVKEPANAEGGVFASVLVQELAAAQATLAQTQVLLEAANVEKETLQKLQATFSEITSTAINRMQVPMGGASANHAGMGAEALIELYHTTLESFQKRFPVGEVASAPDASKEDGNRKGNVLPLTAPAAARATRFRQGD